MKYLSHFIVLILGAFVGVPLIVYAATQYTVMQDGTTGAIISELPISFASTTFTNINTNNVTSTNGYITSLVVGSCTGCGGGPGGSFTTTTINGVVTTVFTFSVSNTQSGLYFNTSTNNIFLSLATSSATSNGFLTAADWVVFNAKQPAGSYLTSETDPVWITASTSYLRLDNPVTSTWNNKENTLTFNQGLLRTGDTITNNGVLSVIGTANQVVVSSATGTVTFSLPQSIGLTSLVTFNSITTTNFFTTNASSTNASSTNLYLGGLFVQSGFTDCSSESVTVSYNAVTGKFGCNTDSGGSAIFQGVTSTVVMVSTSLYSVATSSIINLAEPQIIPTITAANTYSIYSDDPTRMLQYASTTAAATLYLRNGSFANANQMYFGITAQSIANTALYGIGSTINGAVTYQGYHYVLLTSSTQAVKATVLRATSSNNINLSLRASWVTTTFSGQMITGTTRLVGAANGSLYFVSSTAILVPYAITTSTNALAAASETASITISGALMSPLSTRVNDNGIYAGFSSAPFLRKYSFTGTLVGGLNMLVAAPGNGPDVFAMKTAIYGLAGGSTTNLTKLNF